MGFFQKSEMDGIFSKTPLEFFDRGREVFVFFTLRTFHFKYRELFRSDGRELFEKYPHGTIGAVFLESSKENFFENTHHARAIDICLSHIRRAIFSFEFPGTQRDSYDFRALSFSKKCFVGSLKIDEHLSPQKMRIIIHFMIKRPARHDTFTPFGCIVWQPHIDSVKFKPEAHTILSEDTMYVSRIHIIEIEHRFDSRSKTLGTSLRDVWYCSDGQSPKYFLDSFFGECGTRPKRLVEFAKHFRPDSRVGNADRNRNSNIMQDFVFEFFSETRISSGDIRHVGEELVNRKDFHFSKFCFKVF